MSGSCPIIGPLPLQLLEKGWKTLLEAAEISTETPEERLEELRSLSQDYNAGVRIQYYILRSW
jgi:hypothetical protein